MCSIAAVFFHLPPALPVREIRVHVFHEKLIKATLGLARGDMYIGMLRGYDIQVELITPWQEANRSVLAKTGSGKSYTAILEELLERRVSLLIIDPHGEYASERGQSSGGLLPLQSRLRGYPSPSTPRGRWPWESQSGPPRFNGLNLSAREVAKMIPHEGSSSGQLGLLYDFQAPWRSETDVYLVKQSWARIAAISDHWASR